LAGLTHADFLEAAARASLLTVSEIQRGLLFLDEFEGALASAPQGPDNRRRQAWAQLCDALLASNEFLFKE
jgi:hypothetical protein